MLAAHHKTHTGSSFSITNTTRIHIPLLPFKKIKEAVLGNSGIVSLVFIGNTRSHTLNRTYRNKDKPTNVLAFPLEKNGGEIFINLHCVSKEAPLFKMNARAFIGYLFIHALLHLKGLDHGSTMEREEKRLRARFHI